MLKLNRAGNVPHVVASSRMNPQECRAAENIYWVLQTLEDAVVMAKGARSFNIASYDEMSSFVYQRAHANLVDWLRRCRPFFATGGSRIKQVWDTVVRLGFENNAQAWESTDFGENCVGTVRHLADRFDAELAGPRSVSDREELVSVLCRMHAVSESICTSGRHVSLRVESEMCSDTFPGCCEHHRRVSGLFGELEELFSSHVIWNGDCDEWMYRAGESHWSTAEICSGHIGLDLAVGAVLEDLRSMCRVGHGSCVWDRGSVDDMSDEVANMKSVIGSIRFCTYGRFGSYYSCRDNSDIDNYLTSLETVAILNNR